MYSVFVYTHMYVCMYTCKYDIYDFEHLCVYHTHVLPGTSLLRHTRNFTQHALNFFCLFSLFHPLFVQQNIQKHKRFWREERYVYVNVRGLVHMESLGCPKFLCFSVFCSFTSIRNKTRS